MRGGGGGGGKGGTGDQPVEVYMSRGCKACSLLNPALVYS